MRAFLDTSVLVAAFWGEHPQHSASRDLVAELGGSTSLSAHSLAEFYATMTRLPVKPAIPPEHVTLFIDQVVDQFQVVSLNAHEYAKVIHTAGEGGITGGRIYDALLLQCARKSAAEAIYTWNLRHFTAIAPDLADRIQTP